MVVLEARVEYFKAVQVVIDVHLTSLAFPEIHPEDTQEKLHDRCMKKLIGWLYPNSKIAAAIHDAEDDREHHSQHIQFDPKALYDAIRPSPKARSIEQPPAILPQLRPYQLRCRQCHSL